MAVNVWGTEKALINGEEFCVECEREVPFHYRNCPLNKGNGRPLFHEPGKCYFCGNDAEKKVTFPIPAINQLVTDWVCEKDMARAERRNKYAE